MPEFDLDGDLDKYFSSDEWKEIIKAWVIQVGNVVEYKGQPPKMY
jgi:hypothetical protein